ncbi:AAA-domain-containing protein [Pisolithus orientalis]|uniref:AAA-domain-containing protein n=1 Tax=Pisolithus orientalis TaxID=936130 RepID=UPI0022243F65|nr:AAA-domain-containing protein [Pisolithus orientalis]KAI5988685.1 AAA-domain-containing protein [Pisolithus orientalis]
MHPRRRGGDRLTIKLPPAGHRQPDDNSMLSPASGSEYHDSSEPVEMDINQEEPEEQQPEPFTQTRGGRRIKRPDYYESQSEQDPSDLFNNDNHVINNTSRRSNHQDDDDEEDQQPRRSTRSKPRRGSGLADFIVSDEEDSKKYRLRERRKPPTPPPPKTSSGRVSRQPQRFIHSVAARGEQQKRPTRKTRRTAAELDDGYVDQGTDGSSSEASLANAPRTSSDVELDQDAEGEPDPDAEGEGEVEVEQEDGRPYAFRRRTKINYAVPPPLEELKAPPPPRNRTTGGRGGKRRGPGWSATGAELGRWMGVHDDSDSDVPLRTPRRNLGDGALLGAGAMSAGGLLPGDFAAATAGTPSNLGKIGEAALADADPLGVNQNVTFDEIGGLDDHIHALKEMTLLPLLYPEVFQRFGLTPPRGVLFHGPPGTGKTLLARALAATCRSNGKCISFFMRKGADCLSKWVGEAERQLRLLFEEARTCQPSIIFFDEIDGLAPVRSSKQDQIHASIVSTLLALMDGMDGRGQVIVIGATNRPDAVDPALRRPGRFDREFYFPLPTLEARERILGIMTRKWQGWEGEQGAENVKGLARMTKGYGGADLRALCTEAALNAIQRRYPQIYQSNDRLLLKPETIGVTLRDFMIAVPKLVPSSARSTSTSASPLPAHLVPLLGDALDRVKSAMDKVLPVSKKKRSALEEAEWEDRNGEEGALEREMIMQSMETMRVFRPRVVIHGPAGMGQAHIGAAALYHLEGCHVQTLDLGTLMGDSTRTPDAAVVQLFVEAKRHPPSVIYIPSLLSWCTAVPEATRSTVRAMLESLSPTDQVLFLAVADGPLSSLPSDVKTWFGITRGSRIALDPSTPASREAFFASLIADIRRPPNAYPDGIARRKRVLEVLPLAPPPEPRQPSAAELAVQVEADRKVMTVLKYRLGPILTELKRKFKRFTKRAREDYDFDAVIPPTTTVEIVASSSNVMIQDVNGIVEVTNNEKVQEVMEPDTSEPQPPQPQLQPHPTVQLPILYDMDLERMHIDLYKDKYLTPQDFLDDIRKIVHNATVCVHKDPDRLHKAQAMLTAAEMSMLEFDPQFGVECRRMAARERKRREERRKEREKEKEKERANGNGGGAEQNGNGNGAYAPGTRRSARHNGQQPEIQITDPLQLERRLKRARSSGEMSGGGSPDAGPGDDKDKDKDKVESGTSPRQQKRARTVSSEDDEHDPIDFIRPCSSSQQRQAPSVVRFANGGQLVQEDMVSTFVSDPPPQQRPGVIVQNGVGPDTMVVDHHYRPAALSSQDSFNPFLVVDPILPRPQPEKMPTMSISRLLNGDTHASSSSRNPTPTPSPIPPPQQQQSNELPHFPPIPSLHSPPRTPVRPSADPAPSHLSAEPMVVSPPPREPSRPPTPLPDFHVDGELLSTFQYQLTSKTDQFSVEMLEQLRAICVGCVWRHRTEWNRDALVRELVGVLDEYLDDATAAAGDVGSSSSSPVYGSF